MGQDITTTTTGNRLSSLNREISDLTDLLRPASDDAAVSRVMSLRNAGLEWPTGIDGKTAPRVYGFALKGLPLGAIKSTVAKIIRGEVPSIKKFMPTPPELAALVRSEVRPIVEDLSRARATVEAMQRGAPVEEKTPEAIERVRQLVAGVKLAAKEAKEGEARGYRPEMPLSPEEAEHYRKILALPDAKEVNEEHLAYRRRIASKLEASEGEQ